jgi:hypothetical protein
MARMKLYRIYTGDDDRSHFQVLDSGKTSELFNKTREAKGLLFRNDYSPFIVNFHNPTHRRWCITLSGSVDIGIGDGTTITFNAGDVFLSEDLTGQGHTASPHDWVRVYVDV